MIETLDIVFGFLTVLNPVLVVLIFSAVVSLIINLCYKFLVDPEKARTIKNRIRELSVEMREKQKTGNIEDVNALMSEMMKNNMEHMKLTFKPMIASFLPVMLILPWLNYNYSSLMVRMPLSLPIIGNVIPFGWLGWYFVSSIPFVLMTRKLLKVEV